MSGVVCVLCAYCVRIVCVLCAYCVRIVCVLRAYCVHIVCVLCAYCVRIVFVLCAYFVRIVFVLFSYCQTASACRNFPKYAGIIFFNYWREFIGGCNSELVILRVWSDNVTLVFRLVSR